MKSLSMDLRQRIVEAYERGEGSSRELARRFSVGHATIDRLVARFRKTGSVAPTESRHGPLPTVREEDFDRIAAWLEAEPDLTQQELADRFTQETGRQVSQRTMSRVLRRMRQTRKKRR